MGVPEKLEWQRCCDHPTCKRMQPTNLGTFTYGTGFEPDEREAIDAAWALRSLAITATIEQDS